MVAEVWRDWGLEMTTTLLLPSPSTPRTPHITQPPPLEPDSRRGILEGALLNCEIIASGYVWL